MLVYYDKYCLLSLCAFVYFVAVGSLMTPARYGLFSLAQFKKRRINKVYHPNKSINKVLKENAITYNKDDNPTQNQSCKERKAFVIKFKMIARGVRDILYKQTKAKSEPFIELMNKLAIGKVQNLLN